ncbi:MAG: NADP-dependent phosphogluconate dehydrogenase [Pikeienuella sp.]
MAADIGLVGAGVMGGALALNLAEKGYSVAVSGRSQDKVNGVADAARSQGLSGEIIACSSVREMVAAIRPPRPFLLLVPAGDAVDSVIAELRPLIDKGDLIIDAGNANFHNTRRRTAELEADGYAFLGLGVSGGSEGARHGPAIMAGGSPALWERVREPLQAISAKHNGEACCDWFGPDGAGHFVKTIHNGIEYADMQMIAEAYGVMRDGLGMDAGEIADVFKGWNEGPLGSFLIEITGETAGVIDADTGVPLLDVIQDKAGQKGTGRWSVIEAQHLAAPAGVMEAAVIARNISSRKAARGEMQAIFGAAPVPLAASRDEMLAMLEQALIAGKIACYAQGFEVFRAASAEYSWGLDYAAIAKVWRAGCIIRSVFLDDIARVLGETPDTNLMATDFFAKLMKTNEGGLRQVVAACALNGLAAPALSSALSYFDMSRTERGTANMVQIQRDFFGHHGFERLDRDGGGYHGPWVK